MNKNDVTVAFYDEDSNYMTEDRMSFIPRAGDTIIFDDDEFDDNVFVVVRVAWLVRSKLVEIVLKKVE